MTAHPPGCLQVEFVRRDHHDGFGRQAKQTGGRAVDLRVRLVAIGQLSGKYAVPREACVPGKVDKQRHVAVGERGRDISFSEPPKAFGNVGPGSQSVPHTVETLDLRFRKARETILLQEAVQDQPVKSVQGRPGQLALSDAVHRGAVSRPPGVGKRLPIRIDSVRPPQAFSFFNHTATPVDDGPENVERERLDFRTIQSGRAAIAG